MTWILDRQGIILFKSFWSRPDLTHEVIEDILDAQDEGKRGHYGQPFYTERLAWRRPDPAHDDVMAENGPQAVVDFERMMEWRKDQEKKRAREGRPRGF